MKNPSNIKLIRSLVSILFYIVLMPATLLTLKVVIFSSPDVPVVGINSFVPLSTGDSVKLALSHLPKSDDADYIRSVVEADHQVIKMLKEGWIDELRLGSHNARFQLALWVIVDVISLWLLLLLRRK